MQSLRQRFVCKHLVKECDSLIKNRSLGGGQGNRNGRKANTGCNYWCGHHCGKQLRKPIENSWGVLWNPSHNCPFSRQKEKGVITSDFPVVKVCLTGMKFLHTTRLCLYEGREQGSHGLPGLQHQRSPRTGRTPLPRPRWGPTKLHLHRQVPAGTEQVTQEGGWRDFEGVHQKCPLQFLFSLSGSHSPCPQQIPSCGTARSHPRLGVMLIHRCQGGYEFVYLPFLAPRVKAVFCQQDTGGWDMYFLSRVRYSCELLVKILCPRKRGEEQKRKPPRWCNRNHWLSLSILSSSTVTEYLGSHMSAQKQRLQFLASLRAEAALWLRSGQWNGADITCMTSGWGSEAICSQQEEEE